MKCPKCAQGWPKSSEQAICIEKHGGCMACECGNLTTEQGDDIAAEARTRKQRGYAKSWKRLKLRIALWLHRDQPFICGEIREEFKRKYDVEV